MFASQGADADVRTQQRALHMPELFNPLAKANSA